MNDIKRNIVKPKVSIIIPAYNVEKYVSKCLDTVINQTLKDIEIIIVDDKSTDNTLSLVKKYAELDKRIRIIEFSANNGVSVARNVGIDSSSGEYIGFVDPDDYIDLDFYEKLYYKAKKGDADIISGNVDEILFNGKSKRLDKMVKSFQDSKYNFSYTLWLAIYKTSFIKENKIYNPVGVLTSQDTVFCVKCACLANRIDIVLDAFYHYIRVENSLSSVVLSEKKILSKIKAMELILEFVNQQKLKEKDYNLLSFGFFQFISEHAFSRNTKREIRMLLMNASVDLYKKYKYPAYIKKTQPNLYQYLESEDAEGLYLYNRSQLENSNEYSLLLFGKIPLIKVRKYLRKNKYKIYILGVPLFVLSKSSWVKYYG